MENGLLIFPIYNIQFNLSLFLISMLKVFKYMINKRNLPIVMLVLATGILWHSIPWHLEEIRLLNMKRFYKMLGECLKKIITVPKISMISFPGRFLRNILGEVDVEKKNFLKSDIDGLTRYETSIDDEILGKARCNLCRL